jgi:hypothetical protein
MYARIAPLERGAAGRAAKQDRGLKDVIPIRAACARRARSAPYRRCMHCSQRSIAHQPAAAVPTPYCSMQHACIRTDTRLVT